MGVSLMVRVMAVSSGSRSWFGFQVGLRFAGASGFEELDEGRWLRGLPAAELVDHDGVLGTAWWPAVGEVGEGEVIGVVQFAHVLGPWAVGGGVLVGRGGGEAGRGGGEGAGGAVGVRSGRCGFGLRGWRHLGVVGGGGGFLAAFVDAGQVAEEADGPAGVLVVVVVVAVS